MTKYQPDRVLSSEEHAYWVLTTEGSYAAVHFATGVVNLHKRFRLFPCLKLLTGCSLWDVMGSIHISYYIYCIFYSS